MAQCVAEAWRRGVMLEERSPRRAEISDRPLGGDATPAPHSAKKATATKPPTDPELALKQAGAQIARAAGIDYASAFQFAHNSATVSMPKGHWAACCIFVATPGGTTDCSVCTGLKARLLD